MCPHTTLQIYWNKALTIKNIFCNYIDRAAHRKHQARVPCGPEKARWYRQVHPQKSSRSVVQVAAHASNKDNTYQNYSICFMCVWLVLLMDDDWYSFSSKNKTRFKNHRSWISWMYRVVPVSSFVLACPHFVSKQYTWIFAETWIAYHGPVPV